MLTNFRNVSGTKLIYRSAIINEKSLTEEDKAQLSQLGLDTLFDLRCKREVKEKPDFVPNGTKYIQLEVFDSYKYRYVITDIRSRILAGHLRGPFEYKLVKNKIDSYEAIALSDVWEEIFLAMDRGEKFLFHCTEGKDRTGICAMLIEHCLGISDEEIMNNYLLSNELRPAKDRSNLKYAGISKKLIDDIKYAETTHEELLLHAYDTINKSYGSLDNMLLKKFNVTEDRKNRWKAIYCDTN